MIVRFPRPRAGIEIGEGRVPANVADRVDEDRRRPLQDLGIVEVAEHRQADLDRGFEPGAHEGLEVVDPGATHAELRQRSASVRL
jgi:hypothetical protein